MTFKIVSKTAPAPRPSGKRTVRANRYGNVNGYIGGRFYETLGVEYAVGTAEAAAAFLAGGEA